MSWTDFPLTHGVLKAGPESGLHFSGQCHVRQGGEVLLDEAFGTSVEAASPAGPESTFLWMSSGKPVTAIAIALLVQKGACRWDSKVGAFIPEFANRGKEQITLGHILSQSAALRNADAVDAPTREEILEKIYGLPLEAGQQPGSHAGYHVGGTWLVLGEVVRRITGNVLEDFLHEAIFQPLGMTGTSLGTPQATLPENFIPMFDTSREPVRVHPVYGTDRAVHMPRPGRNLMGPIRELARFYSYLRDALKGDPSFLDPDLVREMIRPQRPPGQRDRTFGHPADFGYGFYLHPDKYGKGKSSYGYGQYASETSFGHSGAQSSCGFYDPEEDLIVTWVVDGMPGEPKHQRRARAINEAIYRDLELQPGLIRFLVGVCG
jgi:CubicO group peptidase (beta-lactamase class C family)